MKNHKVLLLVCALTTLGGCSKVAGIFGKEDKTPPLEGDRISVLDLQKSLEPDAISEGGQIDLGALWVNDIWPQAGGYPSHAMHNVSLSGDNLKLIWKVSIGAGSSKKLPLTAQPIVVNDTIYALDSKSNLRAINAQTGKVIWSKDVSNDDEDETVITGGVAYAGQTILVTNGTDEVLALSPADGSLKWRRDLAAPSRAAPSALGGRVFVSTLDNRLYALNIENGNILWDYSGISETAGLLGAASPAIKSDIVVPAFSSGEITALRVENGSVAWSDNLSNVRRFDAGLDSISDIRAMPVLDRGLVLAISFGGKIAAIDERTGMRVWQREIGGSETPWVAGNVAYVVSDDNQLVALRLQDGAIIWIHDLPRFENLEKKKDKIMWSGPVLAGGRLIVAGSDGTIIELDANNGKGLRQWDSGKPIYITPLVVKNMLYILANDGTLMAYR